MQQFPGLKAQDKAEIVDRVFQMKVKDFLKYLKTHKALGNIAASMLLFMFYIVSVIYLLRKW